MSGNSALSTNTYTLAGSTLAAVDEDLDEQTKQIMPYVEGMTTCRKVQEGPPPVRRSERLRVLAAKDTAIPVYTPRVCKKSSAIDMVRDVITFEKSTKCPRKVQFALIPEESMPFATTFKEYEQEIH